MLYEVITVIDSEFLEVAEQGVDGGEPGLMRCHMSELVRARDIAATINVRIDGLQILVHFDGTLRRQADTELFQAVALCACGAPDGP